MVKSTSKIHLRGLDRPRANYLRSFRLAPRSVGLLDATSIFVVGNNKVRDFVGRITRTCPGLGVVRTYRGVSLLSKRRSSARRRRKRARRRRTRKSIGTRT